MPLLFRAQDRDRTGMEVNPLVFETSASTNSATWACGCFEKRCKGKAIFLIIKIFLIVFFYITLQCKEKISRYARNDGRSVFFCYFVVNYEQQ